MATTKPPVLTRTVYTGPGMLDLQVQLSTLVTEKEDYRLVSVAHHSNIGQITGYVVVLLRRDWL